LWYSRKYREAGIDRMYDNAFESHFNSDNRDFALCLGICVQGSGVRV
jgi:hypothetical protein